jgi:alpha-galactosidase
LASSGSCSTTAGSSAGVTTSGAAQSGRVLVPGLDPDRSCAIRVRTEIGEPERHRLHDPAWLEPAGRGDVVVPGAVLIRAGLPMPSLHPAQALILELAAVE